MHGGTLTDKTLSLAPRRYASDPDDSVVVFIVAAPIPSSRAPLSSTRHRINEAP